MFSKACEYGIKATIFIAEQTLHDNRVSLKEIAGEIDSPVAFTAKILQLLAKSNIIVSVKGQTGGYEISKKNLSVIKLNHIVNAIDGDTVYTACGLGLKECSEVHPCPVHFKFKKVRNELKNMLENTSLHDLSVGSKNQHTFLKM